MFIAAAVPCVPVEVPVRMGGAGLCPTPPAADDCAGADAAGVASMPVNAARDSDGAAVLSDDAAAERTAPVRVGGTGGDMMPRCAGACAASGALAAASRGAMGAAGVPNKDISGSSPNAPRARMAKSRFVGLSSDSARNHNRNRA